MADFDGFKKVIEMAVSFGREQEPLQKWLNAFYIYIGIDPQLTVVF